MKPAGAAKSCDGCRGLAMDVATLETEMPSAQKTFAAHQADTYPFYR
jgi:hypothetical protein